MWLFNRLGGGSYVFTFAEPPRGLGGPRANTKSGALQNGLCEGGLGAPEALSQYIYTCKLPSSVSGFRSKSTTYGALASKLHLSEVCVRSIKCKANKQANFSRKYSGTNPLKKLDWNVTDEPDLI